MSERLWNDYSFIAFDTETTGPYPVSAEVCEVAAVRWEKGKIVDEFSSLIKPRRRMNDEVIAIHGITNEMVASAPPFEEVGPKFREFLQTGVPLAHHAQFDMGFLAYEYDRAKQPLPTAPVLCTSLLSQKVMTETENHKLKTLTKYFNVDPGQAHRALDDARACMNVALRLFERVGPSASLDELAAAMLRRSDWNGLLTWPRFSVEALRNEDRLFRLILGIERDTEVMLKYGSGRHRDQLLPVRPLGLVRQMDGDFAVILREGETQPKRFYLEKILSVIPIPYSSQ